MDIDTAKGLVASAPEQISELRERLAEHHSEHPQRAQLADLALREVEQALEKLAALGHRFYLTEQAPEEFSQYPVMLYRDGPQGLETQTVEGRTELEKAEADGWRDHPTAVPSPPSPPIPLEPSDPMLQNPEPPVGGAPASEPAESAGLPPKGAAGPGSESEGKNIVSEIDTAQHEQLANAEQSVEHHDN